MQKVEIRGEFITLGQLLKLAGLISSGGDARDYLAESQVTVNGEPENRRGRKVRPGETVSVPGVEPIQVESSGVVE